MMVIKILFLGFTNFKKYNFNATCFIVSSLLGKKNLWDVGKKNFVQKI